MGGFLSSFFKCIAYGVFGVCAVALGLVALIVVGGKLRNTIDRNFNCPTEQFLTTQFQTLVQNSQTGAPIVGARVSLAALPPYSGVIHGISEPGGGIMLPKLKPKPSACPDHETGWAAVKLKIEADGYEPYELVLPEPGYDGKGSLFFPETMFIGRPAVVDLVPRDRENGKTQ